MGIIEMNPDPVNTTDAPTVSRFRSEEADKLREQCMDLRAEVRATAKDLQRERQANVLLEEQAAKEHAKWEAVAIVIKHIASNADDIRVDYDGEEMTLDSLEGIDLDAWSEEFAAILRHGHLPMDNCLICFHAGLARCERRLCGKHHDKGDACWDCDEAARDYAADLAADVCREERCH